MASARFQKSVPREASLYEHIGPEISRRRLQIESRPRAWRKQGAQVAKEDARARRQLDQKSRDGFGLLYLLEGPNGHLLIVDAKTRIRIAGRAKINDLLRLQAV